MAQRTVPTSEFFAPEIFLTSAAINETAWRRQFTLRAVPSKPPALSRNCNIPALFLSHHCRNLSAFSDIKHNENLQH
jgi:hypothetical protein